MTLRIDRTAALRAALDAREEAGRLRRVEPYVPEPGTPYVSSEGERLLSFCSNDYLGLATDPRVVAGAASAADRRGAGAGASRLVCGGSDLHDGLESDLASFTGREAALLFSSGFQANASVIPALGRRGGLVVCDERAHHSILQGCRLGGGEWLRYRHNDAEHLDSLLTEHGPLRDGPPLVVTESLFSMDGDVAPLEALCNVVDRHGALLMVDEAHAIGVRGEGGEGLAAAHPRVDVVLGTFGKAFGSSGAFVASSALLRSYLVNYCGGVIYSTAPAPPVLGAAQAALDEIRSGRLGLARYTAFTASTRERLRAAGFDPSPSTSQIVPVRLGSDRAALDCEAHLRSRGILAVAIRSPTVPEGTARVRLSLTRLHTTEHVDRLVAALVEHRDREAA